MDNEYPITEFLIEYFIWRPAKTFYHYVKTREEEINMNIRNNNNEDTSDMMKVKFLFFDWIIFTEEGCIITIEQDSEVVPDSWTDDTVREYKIKYLDKVYDVTFARVSDGTCITTANSTDPNSIVARCFYNPPLFVARNEKERKTDRRLCTGIVTAFGVHLRPLFVRAALGCSTRKRSHGSDSSSTLPGHRND